MEKVRCKTCTKWQRCHSEEFLENNPTHEVYCDEYEQKGYYNDGGKHECCTLCGKPVEFTEEKTEMKTSGNILHPWLMPMKKRKTKVASWICHHCGETGQNMYILE